MCLIYHCIEAYKAGKHPSDFEVTEQTANQVISLYKGYILPNLITFYMDVLGDGISIYKNIRQAADHILRKDLFDITTSDLRNYASMKHMPIHERREILAHMSEAGWLRPDGIARDAVSGSPKRYLINPLVHVRFKSRADYAKDKLEAIKNSMLECGYGIEARTA
jgi:hypothetical protein